MICQWYDLQCVQRQSDGAGMCGHHGSKVSSFLPPRSIYLDVSRVSSHLAWSSCGWLAFTCSSLFDFFFCRKAPIFIWVFRTNTCRKCSEIRPCFIVWPEMLPMESYISEVKQTARTRLLWLQKAVNQALKVLLNVCVCLLAHCGTGCHTGYFWEFKRSCWKLHLSLATRAGFGCTLENTEWGAPSTQCVLVQFSTMLIIISSN